MTAEDLDDEMDDSKPEDDNEGEGEGEGGKARKRKERLEQNRISARESRKRKKTMIEELQRTVITLSRENKELNERNEQLRRQLMEIGAKVRSCRDASCLPTLARSW
jgi:predicted RNase H-like nuclease (RuvC/YqgF family)